MTRARKIWGAALALLWVLTISLVVIWDQNTFSIITSALGIAAALLILFSLRWWRGVAALASALFVVNWAQAFFVIESPATAFNTYGSVIRGALQTGLAVESVVVLSYEVVLPMLHLIVSVFLSVGLMKRKAVTSES